MNTYNRGDIVMLLTEEEVARINDVFVGNGGSYHVRYKDEDGSCTVVTPLEMESYGNCLLQVVDTDYRPDIILDIRVADKNNHRESFWTSSKVVTLVKEGVMTGVLAEQIQEKTQDEEDQVFFNYALELRALVNRGRKAGYTISLDSEELQIANDRVNLELDLD